MQLPITATGLYRSWSTANWDFGTSGQFPVVKNADSNILLNGQGVGLRDLEILTGNVELVLRPVLTDSEQRYTAVLPSSVDDINLKLRAYNTNATIKVAKQGQDNDYFADWGSDGQSGLISIDEDTALIITVTEADVSTVSYKISFEKVEISDITVSESGTTNTSIIVNEGSTITLDAAIIGNSENHDYEWMQTEGKSLRLSSNSNASLNFTVPADYITSTTSTSTDVVIRSRLVDNHSNSLSFLNKRITIRKIDNHKPALDSGLAVNGFTLSFDERSITDLDGIGIFRYQWQSQDINAEWVDIPSATTASYTVLQTEPNDRLYRVQVTYIDAQGHESTESVFLGRLSRSIKIRIRVFLEGFLH